MMRKKAIIASQFNWLFILIVGAVILFFFVTSSRNQEKNADVELAVNFLEHLSPILSASERSPGTLQKIEIPDMKIELACDDTYSKLMVGDGYEQDMTYNIVFSTKQIEHKYLYTWSLDWNTPYKTASFLYLTTPSVKYYFVNDSGYIRELYNNFPKNISAELINASSSLTDTGYQRYVFVYYNDLPAITINYDKVFGVKVNPSNDLNILDSHGELTFTKGNQFGEEEKSVYLGLPLIYGAIFSEDVDFYNCTLQKAMKRLKIANGLNKRRIEGIGSALPSGHACEPLYVSPIDYSFPGIASNANDKPTIDNLKIIYEEAQSLRRSNEDLIRGYSCPLIY